MFISLIFSSAIWHKSQAFLNSHKRQKSSMGPFKNDITKKSAISNSLLTCQRPKTDKAFPDKLSAKVNSRFSIAYVYYTIFHTRLPFTNSNEKTIHLYFMLLIRRYMLFRLQIFRFEKIILTGTEMIFSKMVLWKK